MIRKALVTVYLDQDVIGSGYIEYLDDAKDYVAPMRASRSISISAPVYLDTTAVGSLSLDLSYEDIICQGLGGLRTIDFKIPVYIDTIVAGEMSVSLIDSYGRDWFYIIVNQVLPVLGIFSVLGLVMYLLTRARRRGF